MYLLLEQNRVKVTPENGGVVPSESPPMQNPALEAVLFLATLLKSGDHTLDDLFKKQVGDTLIQRIAKRKLDIKRQIRVPTAVCLLKFPVCDKILEESRVGNIDGDGAGRVERDDAGVLLGEKTESDGEICDECMVVDDVGDVGMGAPGDKIAVLVDIGDHLVELGRGEGDKATLKVVTCVWGATAGGGGVVCGLVGIGGDGGGGCGISGESAWEETMQRVAES